MSVPVLLYHQIAELPDPKVPYKGLFVHPRSFRSQMRWLKGLGYKGLSVRDAWPYLRGEKKGKVVVITFDDGFLNTLENAAPALAEVGFTATNYFVANQVGGSNVWDEKENIPLSPCMNVAQLREWDSLGHEVGAHTLDHCLLPQLPFADAHRQISECKGALEDMVGSEVSSFCYPYGGNEQIHRQIARESGYTSATTTISRRAKPDDDVFGIPRIYIRYRHSTLEALLRVALK
ncbi:polysaccharide deacetylase family protein [Brucella gallinifaecis]|uniref:Chitooligosaccharide deacetylase n=1 Tax=Brucella gallinifaecis TaxID=215590 RepID=A0A502BQU1_9HYPH|nr:polysaccharide deacetylase family protein [Brucella gallinifaecis]TPF76031.1 polysaccharide deacetylase family protein [Brucella gallinifaecis]